METLTKENFWDEIEQKYPKAMRHFKEWIDNYKAEHEWKGLFNANYNKEPWSNYIGGPEVTEAPKYHELPIAMQFGIFYQYMSYWRTLGGIITETGTICIESNIPNGMKMFVGMSLMIIEQKLGGGLVLP